MPLCVLVVYLIAKKDNLKLGKLIDKEDKYIRSAENCRLYFLIVGIKVSIAKCQPEIFGLKSATLTLK